jgi:hypothetical protein
VNVQPSPRDLVRVIVVAEHSAAEGSIEIAREQYAGDQAAIGVTFETKQGVQRRGIFGLRRHSDGMWRPNGGSFTGSVRPVGDGDVWMIWGGWGGDGQERTVHGGWVADPAAVSAKAIDEMTGRTVEDAVENGVALFMYEGNLGQNSRLELLDADGSLLKTGPLHRRP